MSDSAQPAAPKPKTVAVVGKSGTVGSLVIIAVEAGKMVWAHELGDQPWPAEMPQVIEVNLIVALGSMLTWIVGPRIDKSQ